MVTRRAILIGAPGKQQNFLYGVKEDLKNMKSFLVSDRGGAWYNDEIKTLSNPTVSQVFAAVQTTTADYVFVYFSGHGFTSADKRRMLCLQDSNISDEFLLNSSPRQLVIVDACRNYVQPGIGAIPKLEERWSNYTGSPIREWFNRFILQSPAGKIIIHATQEGEYSYDSPDGGRFTLGMLNISSRLKAEKQYIPVSIGTILEFLPSYLKQQGNSQIPCLTYRKGNLLVPFSFRIPSNAKPKYILKPLQPQSSSTGNWVGLGLLALFVVAVASSD